MNENNETTKNPPNSSIVGGNGGNEGGNEGVPIPPCVDERPPEKQLGGADSAALDETEGDESMLINNLPLQSTG